MRIETFNAYQGYLEAHQDELDPLLTTILINVTSFFRDPPAWDAFVPVDPKRRLFARGRAPIAPGDSDHR